MTSAAASGGPDPKASRPSFGVLYAEVAPTLVAWASLRVRRALRGFIEPEDLVQEVCCRAYERFHSFDPAKGEFRRWIFGVGNNVLKETLAAAARPAAQAGRMEVSSRDLLDQIPDDITSVSRRIARDETFKMFIEKLDTLDDDDRKLLIYRGLEGLGHAEAAELLGISRDAAEKRWQRLVRRVEDWRPPHDLFVR
jgi:RNA polymerase sigma factor (sigma-70 family)